MISRALARKLRQYIEKAAVSLTDEDALDAVELYPIWQINTAYAVSDRIRHDGILYRCVQSHTSQADWTPDKTPALWTVVSLDEWPEWVQPTGAQDAYALGAKVSHKDAHWTSDYDNNTWEPSVYGWNEVV
jgi:hypothetical protein